MITYNFLWFFIVYSFIGWVIEVIYQAVVKGKVLNRGFLNGPACPVYGFGMLAVLFMYYSFNSDSFIILFLEGTILTTVIELFAGFILDKFFHARWWDYSKMPMNLNGYICPAFSIIWGFSVVFALRIAHPFIYNLIIDAIPHNIGCILLIIIYIFFAIDTIVTVLTLIGLNRKLKELDNISSSIRNISDKMSNRIGEKSIKTAQAAQEGRIQYELGKAELHDELHEKYEELIHSISKNKYYGAGRLLYVFPNVKHKEHGHIIKDIQERINARKKPEQ